MVRSIALTKTSTSTWRATLSKTRHRYIAVVRPIVTHGTTAWLTPKTPKFRKPQAISWVRCSLSVFARKEGGPFQATLVPVLDRYSLHQIQLDQIRPMAWYRFVPEIKQISYSSLQNQFPADHEASSDAYVYISRLCATKDTTGPKLLQDARIVPFPDIVFLP